MYIFVSVEDVNSWGLRKGYPQIQLLRFLMIPHHSITGNYDIANTIYELDNNALRQ